VARLPCLPGLPAYLASMISVEKYVIDIKSCLVLVSNPEKEKKKRNY